MRPTHPRRVAASLAVGVLLLAACGDDDDGPVDTDAAAAPAAEDTAPSSAEESTDSAGTTAESAAPADSTAPADSAAGSDDTAAGSDDTCSETIEDGVLTIATGEPAFFPWVIDDMPETGEGFEAAVAYAVAEEMGYDADSVTWVRTTFDEAIQPGAKNFDLNLQQYSITDERDENIDFSLPYFTSNQAIVALEGSPAEGATTVADLQDVKFGAQAGTTSLSFITDVIQPNEDPFVYDDNVGAKAALEANQIDAAVFDLPTALYVSAVEIEGSSVIGQFSPDAGGTTDQFGFVLEEGNPLKSCVDAAIEAITESGELEAITNEWLADNTGAPFITLE